MQNFCGSLFLLLWECLCFFGAGGGGSEAGNGSSCSQVRKRRTTKADETPPKQESHRRKNKFPQKNRHPLTSDMTDSASRGGIKLRHDCSCTFVRNHSPTSILQSSRPWPPTDTPCPSCHAKEAETPKNSRRKRWRKSRGHHFKSLCSAWGYSTAQAVSRCPKRQTLLRTNATDPVYSLGLHIRTCISELRLSRW